MGAIVRRRFRRRGQHLNKSPEQNLKGKLRKKLIILQNFYFCTKYRKSEKQEYFMYKYFTKHIVSTPWAFLFFYTKCYIIFHLNSNEWGQIYLYIEKTLDGIVSKRKLHNLKENVPNKKHKL